MKKRIISFLFFCFTLINLCVNAQAIDSLAYYSKLANQPKKDTDLSKAYLFFEDYWKEKIQIKDTIKAIYGLNCLAGIEYKSGFYYESEETASNCLQLINNLNENTYTQKLRISVLNLLGIIYREQGNYIKALKLYNRSLKFCQSAKDSAIIYNNISNTYKDTKKNIKSKSVLEKAYVIIKPTKESLTKALIIDNLGYVKSKIDSTDGIYDMLKALEIRKSLKSTHTIYTSYTHLAKFYQKQHRKEKATVYAMKALQIANQLNSSAYKQDALGLLLELSDDIYAKKYKYINDSIIAARQRSDNKFALMKYDLSKQEKLVQEKELVAQKEKSKRVISQLIGLLLIMITIGVVLFLQSKFKKDLVEKVLKTEARISKKVHDVVANDVYKAMTKLQSNQNSSEIILDDLDKIYEKARDISKENSFIENYTDFTETLKELFDSYKSSEVNIITRNLNVIGWNISIHKKNMLYRVLQELMTNMKKYSKASLVSVAFEQKKKMIAITYKDNGIGCDLIKKNGLLNTENRIKSINGKIIFESKPNEGFKASIVI